MSVVRSHGPDPLPTVPDGQMPEHAKLLPEAHWADHPEKGRLLSHQASGSSPVSEFDLMFRLVNPEQLPSAAGTAPVSELVLRFRLCNVDPRLPSAAGMVPVNELSPRYRFVNAERLPSAAGMVPVNELS